MKRGGRGKNFFQKVFPPANLYLFKILRSDQVDAFFDEVFQKLKNNTFVRVGKSLIVNKNNIYVINLTSQELLLSGSRLRGDFKLKASREALKELKALMEQEGDKS